jgi:hypothetical protein
MVQTTVRYVYESERTGEGAFLAIAKRAGIIREVRAEPWERYEPDC